MQLGRYRPGVWLLLFCLLSSLATTILAGFDKSCDDPSTLRPRGLCGPALPAVLADLCRGPGYNADLFFYKRSHLPALSAGKFATATADAAGQHGDDDVIGGSRLTSAEGSR